MNKAIYYKEWIKVQLYVWVAALAWIGFTAFVLLGIRHDITYTGAEFLWLSIMDYNQILIAALRPLPVILAFGLALVQFVPEMHEKRLKLTLHLPVGQNKIILQMLSSGLLLLAVFFLVQIGSVWLYLRNILANELVQLIIGTALPWYMAGAMVYLMTAWIVIEPTWSRRIFNALLAVGILHLLFYSKIPCAYAPMTWWIAIWLVAMLALPLYSADRFKRGCQD